ncbi:uncharacterized protein LOC131633216 [Vicia villosa]|uniref:uncharacterized protein LOC131633216 n=1 Tax=Vicia villosa TaxID=3911 RepID=UPI00273C1C0E|nr:uncharacterized protein LOC131633216 [Vicia villosa]
MYCIGTQKKVDVTYIIFNHLWNAVRDYRDESRTKKKGIVIPFGRIITNLLVQTKMVEELETAGVIKDPYTIIGSTLNATSLRKMGLIQAIENAPQAIPGVRNRRGPILSEFEMFFLNEQPDIKVRYLNLLKQDGSIDVPLGVCKQKLPTTKDGIVEVLPEAASQKERRTKRKQDVSSISKEKRTEEKGAEENKEVAVEKENTEKEDVVIQKKQKKSEKEDDTKNDEKEVEKKKKRKKTDKTDDEKEDEKVEEKKKSKKDKNKKKKKVEKKDVEGEQKNNEEENKEEARKKEIFAGKKVEIQKKRKEVEADSERPTKKSKESEDEAESLLSLDGEPEPYFILNPDSYSTQFKTPKPELSVGVSFEFLKLKVQTGLEALKAAHNARTNYVATRSLWRAFRREIHSDFLKLQKACEAEAPGPFEPAAPTPPKNLAEILLALENSEAEIPSPVFVEAASESEADVGNHDAETQDAETQDAQNHPAMQHPLKENQADVLMLDAAAETPLLDNSFDASSTGPSILMNTMKALHQNQDDLASQSIKNALIHAIH